MIWPGNRIEHKMTINGARGFTRKIADLLTGADGDIAFFTEFDAFRSSGKVKEPQAYAEFRHRNEQFLLARRARIRGSLPCQ